MPVGSKSLEVWKRPSHGTEHTHLVDLLSWVLQSSKSAAVVWLKMANEVVSSAGSGSGVSPRGALLWGGNSAQSCGKNRSTNALAKAENTTVGVSETSNPCICCGNRDLPSAQGERSKTSSLQGLLSSRD